MAPPSPTRPRIELLDGKVPPESWPSSASPTSGMVAAAVEDGALV